MYYLLVFAINIANLQPVILKDCIEYKAVADTKIESVVKEIEKASKCEKNPDSKVWNCMNEKAGIITKIVILTDKKECKAFPGDTAKKLKTLMGR
ncbi:hypothetical protein [Bdellovibrio sp. HCB-162]|uniref:hypothetical protein n=1 Tax=Bdellovibrio sp. HCB-162 TaxID=3394234 RepID=UPI0039BC98C6